MWDGEPCVWRRVIGCCETKNEKEVFFGWEDENN